MSAVQFEIFYCTEKWELTKWDAKESVELHWEELACDGWGEGLGCEGVVGDDWEAGEAAEEVTESEAAQEGRAVVVQPAGLTKHYQGQAVA